MEEKSCFVNNLQSAHFKQFKQILESENTVLSLVKQTKKMSGCVSQKTRVHVAVLNCRIYLRGINLPGRRQPSSLEGH